MCRMQWQHDQCLATDFYTHQPQTEFVMFHGHWGNPELSPDMMNGCILKGVSFLLGHPDLKWNPFMQSIDKENEKNELLIVAQPCGG